MSFLSRFHCGNQSWIEGCYHLRFIINIVDLFLSVLGWHFGGKKRNVLFCIIWVGFLALIFILTIADAFVADAPWDYVIRFADLGFIVYSIVVVGAFLMELVSQRHQHEEQEHPQQESVAGELAPCQPRQEQYVSGNPIHRVW
ncbi:hypothetical protein Ocin01_17176 [Orchesella cincta]|uniref:Uncharacterized protein n=1 Tax=Orchesella cincta TaxID=48709 RepID=A0A1D2M952_ORCCI|nr:hypothetical protein Ocin01_17176 [Orchesella cincta]